MIPHKKEDGYIYSIFLGPSESETNVLRYRNLYLKEPLQKPYHIQLMELRPKTIRWKIGLANRLIIDTRTKKLQTTGYKL